LSGTDDAMSMDPPFARVLYDFGILGTHAIL
jgi:hypothetical protein